MLRMFSSAILAVFLLAPVSTSYAQQMSTACQTTMVVGMLEMVRNECTSLGMRLSPQGLRHQAEIIESGAIAQCGSTRATSAMIKMFGSYTGRDLCVELYSTLSGLGYRDDVILPTR